MFLTKRKSEKCLIYEIPIIQIGIPNCVGNIYTEESVEMLMSSYNKKDSLYGELISDLDSNNKYELKLQDVTHKLKHLFVQDGFVVAVIEFLKNKKSDETIDLMRRGLVTLRPTISGFVDPDTKHIRVTELIGVDFLPTDERTMPKEIVWNKIK